MIRKKVTYECNICHAEYSDEKEAMVCGISHMSNYDQQLISTFLKGYTLALETSKYNERSD